MHFPPPNRPLPEIPEGKKPAPPPIPSRDGKLLSHNVNPKPEKPRLPVKPTGTEKPRVEKGNLQKKWDKLKNETTKSVAAAKAGIKQSAKTAGKVLWDNFKESKTGGKVIEYADQKTTEWGRKLADRGSGYKASLNNLSDDAKHLLSPRASLEALEEINQENLENITIKQADNTKPTGGKFNEAEWREETKYLAVSSKIHDGLQSGLKAPEMAEAKALYLQIVDLPNVGATAENLRKGGTFEAKGMSYLYKAVGFLNGDITAKNPRSQHVHYKKALRDALRSDYYDSCKNQPNPPPFVKLLNTMAAAEFTSVNVGSVTQNLAEKRLETRIQEQTGSELQPLLMNKEPKDLFNDAVNKERLDIVHAGVGNLEDFSAQIRGEWHPSRMDPLIQGNPANIKCVVTNGKKVITCVRTPTPTDGRCKITPEFKAFLRDLKARGLKYTYVNLQSRSTAPLWKRAIGLDGEARRVKSIEDLGRDPEFRDVLTVVTLDKNSSFHHQAPSKAALQTGIQALKNYAKDLPTDDEMKTEALSSPPPAPKPKLQTMASYDGLDFDAIDLEVDEEMTRLNTIAGEFDEMIDKELPAKGTLPERIAELEAKLKTANKHQFTELASEIVALASFYELQLPQELSFERSAFLDGFMTQLTSPNSGFYLPEKWAQDPAIMLEVRQKLENVYTAVFGKDKFGDETTHLNPAERQDFVEIAYMYLTDWAVAKSGADYFHQGCKDNIDRGGGANWLMMSFMTYLKVVDKGHRGGTGDTELKNMIAALPAKLEEDALWARKRGMLDERYDRALTALQRLTSKIESSPEALRQLIGEYNFKGISFETLAKI